MPAPRSQIPQIAPEAGPTVIPQLVGELSAVWWVVIVFGLVSLAGAFAMRDPDDEPLDVRVGNISLSARALAFIGGSLIAIATMLLIYGE